MKWCRLLTSLTDWQDLCIIYRPEDKSRTFVILEEVGTQYGQYLCRMTLTKRHIVWHAINAGHVANLYFTEWSVNYWKSLLLLLSQVPDTEESWYFPKKLLDKKWLLVMLWLGSRDKRAFERPENKSIIFVITEKICTETVLYLCQIILKQKAWCLIYYSCWSCDKWVFYRLVCKLLKMISPWYLRSQMRNVIETVTIEAPCQNMTIDMSLFSNSFVNRK